MTDPLMTDRPEAWRTLAGIEGVLVSNVGRVMRTRSNARATTGRWDGRQYRVKLGNAMFTVAELVAEAHVAPRPPGGTIAYRDGNARNTAASNLYWVRPPGGSLYWVRSGRERGRALVERLRRAFGRPLEHPQF